LDDKGGIKVLREDVIEDKELSYIERVLFGGRRL
jgi:hypothetical protein